MRTVTVFDTTRRGACRVTDCTLVEAERMVERAYRDRRDCRAVEHTPEGEPYSVGEVWKESGRWNWYFVQREQGGEK
jgi:hypothetical protein